MDLRSTKIKNAIKKSFIGLLILLAGAFFLKIGLWENDYISQKTGTVRAMTISEGGIATEEEVDETEITPQQIAEYNVPANQPKFITLQKIGITKARIISLGTKGTGELATPSSIFDVGWYNASGAPGSGRVMILDGHNGGPTKIGVFKHLPDLRAGDKIEIERGDGTMFTYTVKDNVTVPLSESNEYMKTAFKSPEPGKESLTIITCTGEWSLSKRTYLSRQFLRATLDD